MNEQALIFTDDRAALLNAICRPGTTMSATEIAGQVAEKQGQQHTVKKRFGFARGRGVFASRSEGHQPNVPTESRPQREIDHAR